VVQRFGYYPCLSRRKSCRVSMGSSASTGPAAAETVRLLFNSADAFSASRGNVLSCGGQRLGCDALAAYCIVGGSPDRFAQGQAALQQVRQEAKKRKVGSKGNFCSSTMLDRGLGCMLGNVIGDALGAPLEFSPVRYGSTELKSLCQDEVWRNNEYNSFGLEPGQWTDDSAMALCLADSLLCCGGFDGLDLRQRFHLWNEHGYNNAFGRDPARECKASVGLGGNISLSMTEWKTMRVRTPRTAEGDRFTSGNGSVMRNGAVPVWFRNDLEAGMNAAYEQSRATHGGDEAAELCRLLTYVCTRFINGDDRKLLQDLSSFSSPLYSVACLATSRCEEKHEQNANPIFGSLENRRWDWQSREHVYCSSRAQENPGYIGSYAMDAVAMALHCVYTTTSFEEAVLKAANLRGDSDSVCAVAGQLAGSLYGASAIPEDWIARLQQWDGGSIAARALMLHNQETLPSSEALSDAACATATLLGRSCGQSTELSMDEPKA